MEQAITAEQAERIAAALERIAAALEFINLKTPTPPIPVTPSTPPWTYPNQPYTIPYPYDGGSIPCAPPYPYTTGDFPPNGFTTTGPGGCTSVTVSGNTYSVCGVFGQGGSCYLPKGHSAEHQFVRVTNG